MNRYLTRRAFLGRSVVGAAALAALADSARLHGKTEGGVINPPHLPVKAKRVIWLTMAGGPSHLETFDHKPKLAEQHGKPMPERDRKSVV